ncbi:hypothetical protein DPMN_173943 [Dreissena polymorpha]|uniref:Uncharacterized protein n=1 Tax=Dreissena polymorpha TaxID=45954 RepID=A0A9D4E2I6_DREPO|nr:hypothetical protein DPMN_055221 [Dreissena polymorpha]KAH3772602.1 hypothetical protein DPMN_173943 [Dreissena polymorpha]
MITESLGIDGNVFSSVIVTTIPSGWKCYCSMIFGYNTEVAENMLMWTASVEYQVNQKYVRVMKDI